MNQGLKSFNLIHGCNKIFSKFNIAFFSPPPLEKGREHHDKTVALNLI